MKILLTILMLALMTLSAQPGQGEGRDRRGGLISGIVVDQASGHVVEYAYATAYLNGDTNNPNGTVTDEDGIFVISPLRPGSYTIVIEFMGYEKKTIEDVRLRRGSMRLDLGEIAIKQLIFEEAETVVSATRPGITYQIDKKVISADQQSISASGTAVDLLENVPSVTVDIDGNVALRGSNNFMVLIDNKPTVLDASDALDQIPASTIENIEIITNPSAKFDPDGTSGIINIITKKSALSGISGGTNINAGTQDRYGTDFLLSYRHNGLKVYGGTDINQMKRPGSSVILTENLFNDTLNVISSDGNQTRQRFRYNFQGGIDYDISKNDRLSFGLRYGYRKGESDAAFDYTETQIPGNLPLSYLSESDRFRKGPRFSANLDYQREFGSRDHRLNMAAQYRFGDGDEATTNYLRDLNGILTEADRSTEKGASKRWRFTTEYVYPLSKTDKIEAGLVARLRTSDDNTASFSYDLDADQFVENIEYRRKVNYERNIYAVYGMYSGKIAPLGIQFGMRGEYTDRVITLVDSSESYVIDRFDYFPTAHLSWQISETQQLMLSGTRRIDRPRGYYLEPFPTQVDAYTIRQGNPDIKPEYIESYELAWQLAKDAYVISVEGYFRRVHNKVERVQSAIDETVTLQTIANVGEDRTSGLEMMLNSGYFRWWDATLSANIYHYEIEGELYGDAFSRSSDSWSVRMNNMFKVLPSTSLQLDGRYNSPQVSAQGERKSYYSVNVAIRHEFIPRQMSATLQFRNVLNTVKWASVSEGRDFYNEREFLPDTPIIMLNLSYVFNNFKKDRREGGNGDEGDEMEF
jgi:hypothetical protein